MRSDVFLGPPSQGVLQKPNLYPSRDGGIASRALRVMDSSIVACARAVPCAPQPHSKMRPEACVLEGGGRSYRMYL
jgi:hypothetical protein